MNSLRRKIIILVAIVGIAAIVMMLVPFLEDWLRSEFLPRFGFAFQHGWVLTDELQKSQGAMRLAVYAGFLDSFFRILKIAIWMTIVITIVRFIAELILRGVTRGDTSNKTSSLLRTVSTVVVYIIAFFVIFQIQYPEVPLNSLFAGSTIFGLVVGLALQETLGNLFAGISMQADQPFQVGDVISIPNRGVGVVEGVSWRGVKIRTFQNKILMISNSVLGKESIEVAPKNNLNARLVFFSTPYEVSPTRTIQLVREAVRHAENVSQKMRPIVRIRNLGESAVEWEVKYWLDNYAKYNDNDALIRQLIWYVFNRENVSFPFPTRTLHMTERPKEATVEESINTNAELLNRVPIFSPLSDEETERLAKGSRTRVYAPGEPIVRIGSEGNSMFVIVRGSVSIQIPEGAGTRTVNTLGENDFFGEMSLLTGEKRNATVVATEETEVLRIEKRALKPIFEVNPKLVDSIYEIVEERQQGLEVAVDADPEHATAKKKGVIRSIRQFFGLRSLPPRSKGK